MMASVIMLALIGFGVTTIAMPMFQEVSAQGNMTGNQTANMTDASMESGNISSLTFGP
ncbi:MAG: hypothetical protein ACRD8Z_07705 [Nitrososphaeraceae archaeon]